MDKKENRNPLLMGLINTLIPGSSQLYVNRDWKKFIRTFIFGVLALAAAIATGSVIQQSRGYALPPGLPMGILVTVIAAALFAGGYNTARVRNNETNAATFYNSKRHVPHESKEIQHAEIRKMRDEGLISKQEYDEKNAEADKK